MLTLVVVVAAVAVVLAAGGAWSEAAAWALVLALATRVVPILGSFVIAYWPRRAHRVPPLGAAGLAGTVARETWATIRLFFFYHPFEKLVTRHDPDEVAPGGQPVVLVHGFYANAGFWHRTGQVLRSEGWHNLFALNLEPPFDNIDRYADQLQSRIEEACRRSEADSAIVVAHSMGGLVARACAARPGSRVRHIICLGTPHRGTVLARVLPTRVTRQMRPGSEWLDALNASGSNGAGLTNIYSEHDNIIIPQLNARWGDDNRSLSALGHLEMAFSSALQQKLIGALDGLRDDASP